MSLMTLLELKQNEYKEILAKEKPKNIEKAFRVLLDNHKKVSLGKEVYLKETIEKLDEGVRRIFILMEEYAEEIKQLFIENNQTITHITEVSPQKMINGVINKSPMRANNYETERGNWVFASSESLNGNNPYIARNSKDGMIRITSDVYIYGGNHMHIQNDEQGKKHVVLDEPKYVYIINPVNFKPVVTLKQDSERNYYFEFSNEWISEEIVDINNEEQVKGIEEISDITNVVENYQVLCDINMTQEGIKILAIRNEIKGLEALKNAIDSGRLRYINGECEINVSESILGGKEEKNEDIQTPVISNVNSESNLANQGKTISQTAVDGFAKQLAVNMNKGLAKEAIGGLTYEEKLEGKSFME